MPQVSVCLVSLFLSLFSAVTQNIERCFLQNNSQDFSHLLSRQNSIPISLPEPISFSDQISSQQAYFLFQRIFRTFKTFEFYPEEAPPRFPEKGVYIYKARWSFIHTKNNNQHVFQIFFYIKSEHFPGKRAGKATVLPESPPIINFWKITEIKAEKL